MKKNIKKKIIRVNIGQKNKKDGGLKNIYKYFNFN